MGDYIPFEYPATKDGEYTAVLNEGQILLTRRLQLGLTQHQVAEMAGLCLSQYQRLEGSERFFSGCSMKTGLAVCSVLLLNPTDIVHICIQQADNRAIAPLPLFETTDPHRVGRKKIRRDIMSLTIASGHIIVPEAVITALGSPSHILYLFERHSQRILLSAAEGAGYPGVYSTPSEGALTIQEDSIILNPAPLSANCRLVRDRKGALFVLSDLNTATKA